MRRGVIRLGTATASPVDTTLHHIADGQCSALNPAAVHEHAAVPAHGFHTDNQAIAVMAFTRQGAAITHLAAPLPIEGSGIQHHLHNITGNGLLSGVTIHHKSLHTAALLKLLITTEIGSINP